MKTKKIIADSMPLALKMVRQQLGDNAIIVNTKAIKAGGIFGLFAKQKFEVTAYSVDEEGKGAVPKFELELKAKTRNIQEKISEEKKTEVGEANLSGFHKQPQNLYNYYSQNAGTKEPLVPSTPQPRESDKAVLDELQHMRKMMMNFMINDKENTALPTGITKWVNHLKKQGVDEEIVEYIVNGILKKYDSLSNLKDDVIKKEMMSIIEDLIKRRIPETNTVQETTRMINVVGPTGVGKTTSIAKLATEQVLRQKRRVAMITTDVYRIAAVEQLKTYAGILNVPIEVVRSKDELEKSLNKLEHYDLIYMDTTGRNYKDVKYRESINEYLYHPIKSDNFLVLSL
ncbi:MAG: flagellar biosynthesis protein FlhF, partial [Neobacillus sp.]|nr:flagellar biosynthesis protein FlhF [Neobacillus sp.]